MKKTLVFLLTLLTPVFGAFAQTLAPLAAFPPPQAQREQVFEAPVILGSDEAQAAVVFGLGFDIHFDAAKLEFVGFEWSNGFWGVEGSDFSATDVNVSQAAEGVLKLNLPFLGAEKSIENVKGVATVAMFRVKSDAPVGQRAEIRLKNSTLYDDQIYAFALAEHVADVEIVQQLNRENPPAPRPVLFPNPVQTGTEIQILLAAPFQGKAEISDAAGKKVAEYSLDVPAQIVRLPFAAAQAGVYVLTLAGEKERFSYRLTAR